MRITPSLATATAVTALFALTACGSGDGSNREAAAIVGGGVGGVGAGSAGGEGSGVAPKDGTRLQQLPKAGSMAAAARFVGGYTRCSSISVGPDNYEYFEEDQKYDASWSVTERGSCGKGTRIFKFKDAKTFQAAYKAQLDRELKESPNRGLKGGFLVGQDFAVIATSSSAVSSLAKPGGLLILNCHPKFTAPSGYVKELAQVKGCVLTDYVNDN
ncbi:hypothetical protein AB0B01_04695 [Streptomyces sp. NPDC044571]|uniref:hypothetical protein n=1 Tax=Streptomyces sp. NPDC044571 TaxID=3155371 RepID=UPI0033F9F885